MKYFKIDKHYMTLTLTCLLNSALVYFCGKCVVTYPVCFTPCLMKDVPIEYRTAEVTIACPEGLPVILNHYSQY